MLSLALSMLQQLLSVDEACAVFGATQTFMKAEENATAGGAGGLSGAVFRFAPHGVYRRRANRAAGFVDAAVDSGNEPAVHVADGGSEDAERDGWEGD